jgi:hypothetical protein
MIDQFFHDIEVYVKPLIRLKEWNDEAFLEQRSRQLPSSTQPWELVVPYKSWASALP